MLLELKGHCQTKEIRVQLTKKDVMYLRITSSFVSCYLKRTTTLHVILKHERTANIRVTYIPRLLIGLGPIEVTGSHAHK